MIEICPVCRKGECVPYSNAEWTFDGTTYRLVQCPACGCAHTTPLPTDDVLKRLYATSFDYRWYQDHFGAKLRDCRERVKEYRALLGKRVLDYGGGLGYFSKAVREQGLESLTFDPYIGGEQLPEGGWDAVVCLHVLEHSNHLDETIEKIRGFLSPGGRLILAVPNFAGVGYKTLGMRWVWAQPPLIHIFHFTASGIERLLRRHGFDDFQISFRERWDANIYCDVTRVEWTQRLDRLWGVRPFSKFPPYRKVVAYANSWRRFNGLKRTMKSSVTAEAYRSELQVIVKCQ